MTKNLKHTATILVEGLSVPVTVEIDLERIVAQMGRKAAYSSGGKAAEGSGMIKVKCRKDYSTQVRMAYMERRKSGARKNHEAGLHSTGRVIGCLLCCPDKATSNM